MPRAIQSRFLTGRSLLLRTGPRSLELVQSDLATDPATPGQRVLALSLHPIHLQDAQSLEAPGEDRSRGEVLSYQSTQLEESAPAANVFLLSHAVTRGQSGSPVLTSDSRAVVGIIEGRWLRSLSAAAAESPAQADSIPGAATPIEYAISLLQRQHIAYHPQPSSSGVPAATSANTPQR